METTETTEVKKPVKKTAAKKAPAKKKVVEEAAETPTLSGGSYIYALGRRKTAIAKVYLIKNGKGTIIVNGKPMEKYFTTFESRDMVTSPIKMAGLEGAIDISVKAQGGGQLGQADATRLGISRALIELNPTYRKTLKKLGFLMRDPRAKERKKFGLKKARRAPQWSKR
ncbi:30S ribosomal protein S9 [Candidatus Uhrbacteria bacterium]|nr:30S ribosomal protein S9 [Candidatus Uhrbacteria bacterium]